MLHISYERKKETLMIEKITFMPGKKIAAISAAVGSYQNAAKAQQMQK